MERDRLYFLNLFKFIASVCIACMLHYHDHLLPSYELTFPFTENRLFYFLTTHSWCFVELFFMISGLLFSQVYIPQIEDNRYNIKTFLGNRIVRLYPLAIITSLYMYVIQIVLDRCVGHPWSSQGNISLWNLLVDMMFCGKFYGITNNSPLWYVPVLLLCYVIAFYLTKLQKISGGGWMVYIIPVVLGLAMKMTAYQGFFNNTSRGDICFFLGVILGYFCMYSDRMKRRSKNILLGISVIELVVFAIFAAVPYYNVNALGDWSYAVSFGFFPELLFLCYHLKWLNRFCNNRVISVLGKYSWGIYVWNFPILITFYALDRLGNMQWNVQSKGYWFMLLVVHLAVGAGSYELIEKKMAVWVKDFFALEDRKN